VLAVMSADNEAKQFEITTFEGAKKHARYRFFEICEYYISTCRIPEWYNNLIPEDDKHNILENIKKYKREYNDTDKTSYDININFAVIFRFLISVDNKESYFYFSKVLNELTPEQDQIFNKLYEDYVFVTLSNILVDQPGNLEWAITKLDEKKMISTSTSAKKLMEEINKVDDVSKMIILVEKNKEINNYKKVYKFFKQDEYLGDEADIKLHKNYFKKIIKNKKNFNIKEYIEKKNQEKKNQKTGGKKTKNKKQKTKRTKRTKRTRRNK